MNPNDPELDQLREKVNCAAVLERFETPWRLDADYHVAGRFRLECRASNYDNAFLPQPHDEIAKHLNNGDGITAKKGRLTQDPIGVMRRQTESTSAAF